MVIGSVGEVYQHIFKFQITVHYASLIQCGATIDNLPYALLSYLFRETCLYTEHFLDCTTIGILKDAIVIASSAYDLLEADHIWTINHLEEYKFSS